MGRNRSNSAAVQTEEQTLDLAFLSNPAGSLVTCKKQVAVAIDEDLRSLSATFKGLRKNAPLLMEAVKEAHAQGTKLCPDAIRQMLQAGNLELFKAFLTEKQSQKTAFTGSEGVGIFFRAASMSKAAVEKRAAIAQV